MKAISHSIAAKLISASLKACSSASDLPNVSMSVSGELWVNAPRRWAARPPRDCDRTALIPLGATSCVQLLAVATL